MLPGTNSTVVAVTVRMSPSEAAFGTPIPERREPKDTVPGMPTASSRKPWLSMPARNATVCVLAETNSVSLCRGGPGQESRWATDLLRDVAGTHATG